MMTMNVELSSLKDTYKVLSVLNAKGIGKNEISVTTPTDAHFRAINIHESYDNNQEVMMFSWLSAIVGAGIFAIISIIVFGYSSMDVNTEVSLNSLPILVLFGIFMGGGVGFFCGHYFGKYRTLFKSKRISKNPLNHNVVLKFDLPEVRVEEIATSLRPARPVRIRCV